MTPNTLPRVRWSALVCVLFAALLCVTAGTAALEGDARAATALASGGGTAGADDRCFSDSSCGYDAKWSVNTLMVFSALRNSLKIDDWKKSVNYCNFTYVTCRPSGVEIDLGSAGVTGTLPSTFSPFLNPTQLSQTLITRMTFDGNSGISGTLTADFGYLGMLQHFSAAATSISGSLPDVWGNLAVLETLSLSNTVVSGSLPGVWSVLRSLKTVSLENTQVTGTLPAGWSGLSALQVFNAAGTSVYGTLPTEWSALTSLQTLLLNRTAINGTIPESWGALRSLKTVSLAATNVTGCLPTAWTANMSLTPAAVGLPASGGCEPHSRTASKEFPWWAILIIVVGGVLVVGAVVGVVVCALRRWPWQRCSPPDCGPATGSSRPSSVNTSSNYNDSSDHTGVSVRRGHSTGSARALPRANRSANVGAVRGVEDSEVERRRSHVPEADMDLRGFTANSNDAVVHSVADGGTRHDADNGRPHVSTSVAAAGAPTPADAATRDGGCRAENPLSRPAALPILPNVRCCDSSSDSEGPCTVQHTNCFREHEPPTIVARLGWNREEGDVPDAGPANAALRRGAGLEADRRPHRPTRIERDRPMGVEEMRLLRRYAARRTCVPEFGEFLDVDDADILDSFTTRDGGEAAASGAPPDAARKNTEGQH